MSKRARYVCGDKHLEYHFFYHSKGAIEGVCDRIRFFLSIASVDQNFVNFNTLLFYLGNLEH